MNSINKILGGLIIFVFVALVLFLGAVFSAEKNKSVEGVKTQKTQAEKETSKPESDIPVESKSAAIFTPKTASTQNQETNEVLIFNEQKPFVEKSDNIEPIVASSENVPSEPEVTIPDDTEILLPPPPPTD